MSLLPDFTKWLARNRDRLPVRLGRARSTGPGRREYRFEGVPALRLWLKAPTGMEVAVMVRRNCVELLVEFDVVLRRTGDGYYCESCKSEGHEEYAKDSLTLLARHSFEPFLKWCNENLRVGNLLVIERWGSGSSAAQIVSKRRLKTMKSRLVEAFVVAPIFLSTKARD